MSYEQQVRDSGNLKEALTIIARALDSTIANLGNADSRALDGFDSTGFTESGSYIPADEYAKVEPPTVPLVEFDPDGNAIVNIPESSPEVQEQRRKFAETHLVGLDPEVLESYVKVGPLLLYYTQREELVMQLPREVRTAFVTDVMQHYPDEAMNMSRDILAYRMDEDEMAAQVPDFVPTH